MKTIAFVGLGAMGRPMARNLIKAGFVVQGYDVKSVQVWRTSKPPAACQPDPPNRPSQVPASLC